MKSELTIIDEQAALAALNGNRKLLCELAQIFIEDAPMLLREMDAALESNQLELARRLVHSLRGLSSTFFAAPTTELARLLEEAACQGKIEVFQNGGADRLKLSFENLIQELRACGLVN